MHSQIPGQRMQTDTYQQSQTSASPASKADAALRYAELGLRVVPLHSVTADGGCTCSHVERADRTCECGDPKCKAKHGPGSIGKHPRIPEWQKRASSVPEQITAWWKRWPDANIGLRTGGHLFVLDVDPRNGGLESLARLVAEHGPLPTTPTQRTGSGGTHYLFKVPAGRTVSNGKIAPGLDIKGEDGQIVVAPSVSGRGGYAWEIPPTEPIADAPPWLRARVGKAPAVIAASAGDDRSSLPPASAQDLEDARAALNKHGPGPERIDGEGGGQHAVQAGAILRRDYGLSPEEARPLALEWNETRSTPWEEDELLERVERGFKYGKNPIGCKRRGYTLARIRARIRAWQDHGSPESEIEPMLADVRPLARELEGVEREFILKELANVTGLTKKVLNLPRSRSSGDGKPPEGARMLYVGGRADGQKQAIEVLARDQAVYSKDGRLIQLTQWRDTGETSSPVHRDPEALVIWTMETDHILNILGGVKWARKDSNGDTRLTDFPADYARGIPAFGCWPGVRPLNGISGGPMLDRSFNVISTPGYHAETGYYLAFDPAVFGPVHENPTREDALLWLKRLREPFNQFRWETPVDESVFLAAILTPLTRHLYVTAPGFGFSAPTRGSGKTLLIDSIGILAHGVAPGHANYTRTGDEMKKLITSILLAGDPIIAIDNVDTVLRSPEICNALTGARWVDRRLGHSERLMLSAQVTWLFSGNNLSLQGDLTRRILMCTIDPMVERPETRSFRIPRLLEYLREHRAELLGAALTILRAFHLANPREQATPLGSFERWSRTVREPLIWLGLPDPCDALTKVVEAESETAALAGVLAAWRGVFGSRPVTAPEVVKAIQAYELPKDSGPQPPHEAFHALRDALAGALGSEREITARAVGYFSRRWRGTITGGARFVAAGKDRTGNARWAAQRRDDSGVWA